MDSKNSHEIVEFLQQRKNEIQINSALLKAEIDKLNNMAKDKYKFNAERILSQMSQLLSNFEIT